MYVVTSTYMYVRMYMYTACMSDCAGCVCVSAEEGQAEFCTAVHSLAGRPQHRTGSFAQSLPRPHSLL